MSRSGLMSPFNSVHKSSGGNVSSSGGSSTLSRSSLGSNMSGNKTFSARVVFLDDTCQTFDVDKRAKGQYLVDTVFRHLDIGEKEYFGLMFNDTGADNVPDGHAPDIMRWLDPNKLIRKQVRIIGGQKAGKTKKIIILQVFFKLEFFLLSIFVFFKIRNDSSGHFVLSSKILCNRPFTTKGRIYSLSSLYAS